MVLELLLGPSGSSWEKEGSGLPKNEANLKVSKQRERNRDGCI